MTHGSAQPAEPTPSASWIRNPDLVDYFERIILDKRAEGVTIGQLCERGDISLAQFKRWRAIGGPQSIPEPDNLIAFCVGNRLDPTEPLAILGWTAPGDSAPALPWMIEAQVRDAYGEVQAVLNDPATTPEDAAEIAALLKLAASQLRARNRRQAEQ